VLSAVVGSLACSSGTGTPSHGGSGDCDSICQKAASLGCANYDAADCSVECQETFGPTLDACPSESSSYFGCLQQLPMECDADGEPSFADNEDAIYTQCGSQALALSGCTACVPESDDSACQSCKKQNCCSERKALYSDPATLQLAECYDACTESTCQQACTNQYPSLVAKAEALAGCEQSKCPEC
jgi:hypothetical protein